MKHSKTLLLALSLGIVQLATAGDDKTKPVSRGVDPTAMDRSISPRVDFYNYAAGTWLKNNQIPNTESNWGTFNVLAENNRTKLRQIIENAAKAKAPAGSITQKIGDFYASGMDTLNLEKLGLSPLKPELAKISALKTREDVIKYLPYAHSIGINAFFNWYVYQDDKNSSLIICNATQGGLGLPDKDYYLKADERSQKIRDSYVVFIENLFKLNGETAEAAKTKAKNILALETRLAGSCMSRVEMRDPEASYHKMTIKEANALSPSLNWTAFNIGVGISIPQADINIHQPEFFKTLNKELASTDVNILKDYITWNALRSFSGYLSKAFVNETFKFYSTELQGVTVQKPRWKTMVANTEGALGEAIGQEFTNIYFDDAAKKRCLEMVNNMLKVYGERINTLDWMSAETKVEAQKKLGTFYKKIGFPDKWKNYKGLTVSRTNFMQNVINSNKFDFAEMVNKLGKPVDKTEWLMTPQTVNAYYNPSTNEIAFPAGILQAPFFDPQADDASNYGAIGAVIGHEITHGFDDEGRKYDFQGNLKEWWTKEDGERFEKKAQLVVNQFNNYVAMDTMHVNGELTLGENIADLGGTTIALEAYKLTAEYKANKMIDGLTPTQRFFIAWAQGWKINIRDKAMAQRLVTDPHAPGKFRAFAPLTNIPEFYEAFGIKAGDPMYRPESERAKIW